MRSPKGLLLGMVAVTGLTFLAGLTVLVFTSVGMAQDTVASGISDPGVLSWGFASAAGAAALSALAAGYAVAHVGSAAIGALAEKPELLGRVLILVGLAEGIAIYGLIVAILILNRLG